MPCWGSQGFACPVTRWCPPVMSSWFIPLLVRYVHHHYISLCCIMLSPRVLGVGNQLSYLPVIKTWAGSVKIPRIPKWWRIFPCFFPSYKPPFSSENLIHHSFPTVFPSVRALFSPSFAAQWHVAQTWINSHVPGPTVQRLRHSSTSLTIRKPTRKQPTNLPSGKTLNEPENPPLRCI